MLIFSCDKFFSFSYHFFSFFLFFYWAVRSGDSSENHLYWVFFLCLKLLELSDIIQVSLFLDFFIELSPEKDRYEK